MDVSLDTHNVTLSEVAKAIDAKVKAIIVTHLYGLAISDIQAIADLCSKRNVLLIEDCAQAHGAKVSGKRVGTFGDVASFSFYPTKNLGAVGDGGAIITNSTSIADKLKSLRQYGWKEKYCANYQGGRNSRLDEIQAALLSTLLPQLDDSNEIRRQIIGKYRERIKNADIIFQENAIPEGFVAHLCVVRCKNRDSLRGHLKNMGVITDIHYPTPDYRQSVFKNENIELKLENTETLSKEVLTLPCYPEMEKKDILKVINSVNCWKS